MVQDRKTKSQKMLWCAVTQAYYVVVRRWHNAKIQPQAQAASALQLCAPLSITAQRTVWFSETTKSSERPSFTIINYVTQWASPLFLVLLTITDDLCSFDNKRLETAHISQISEAQSVNNAKKCWLWIWSKDLEREKHSLFLHLVFFSGFIVESWWIYESLEGIIPAILMRVWCSACSVSSCTNNFCLSHTFWDLY